MPVKKKKILPIKIIKLLLIGSRETKPNKQNPKDFTNLHVSSRFPRLSSIQNTTSSCLAIVANYIQSLQRGNEKFKNSCSQDIAVSPFRSSLCIFPMLQSVFSMLCNPLRGVSAPAWAHPQFTVSPRKYLVRCLSSVGCRPSKGTYSGIGLPHELQFLWGRVSALSLNTSFSFAPAVSCCFSLLVPSSSLYLAFSALIYMF